MDLQTTFQNEHDDTVAMAVFVIVTFDFRFTYIC